MSSGRSVRSLARVAGVPADEALIRLRAAGFRLHALHQLVPVGSTKRARAALLAPLPEETPASERRGGGGIAPLARRDASDVPLAAAYRVEPAPTPDGTGRGLKRIGPVIREGHNHHYLDHDTVASVHHQLALDFARSRDPIEPEGTRDDGRHLASAIIRPQTTFEGVLKYGTIPLAAAALLHSLIHNHPFHNGNKRTAIVSLLVYLDINGYVFTGTDSELFKYVRDLAGHRTVSEMRMDRSDSEVEHAAEWLNTRIRKILDHKRRMKWREVKAVLSRHGCTFQVPSGNRLIITRGELSYTFSGYRNEGTEINAGHVMKIRIALGLDEEHGYDTAAFYDADARIDGFINKYRTILRRLAKL